jgi:hypothetical protein
MTARVILLPWIQLHDEIVVGDVRIMPFAEALQLAGDRAPQLRTLASVYVDGYTLPMAISAGVRSAKRQSNALRSLSLRER